MSRYGLGPAISPPPSLTPEAFARVEIAGKVEFDGRARGILAELFAMYGMLLQRRCLAPASSEVRKHLKRMVRTGTFPTDGLDDEAHVAAILAMLRLVPDTEGPTPAQVVRCATLALATLPSGPGRRREDSQISAIWAFADFFENAGAKATASWSEKTGDRGSPFIRFLRTLADEWGEPSNSFFLKNLDNVARDVLRARSGSTIRNNFDGRDFPPF